MKTDKWDYHFLHLALVHARMSKDPSTQVGAVIVGPDREVRSIGFNGFPRGVVDTPERLNNRETKYRLIVHAERNALLNACRVGIPLKDTTIYLAARDTVSNLVWGGPPCVSCTIELIQAGITRVVSWPKQLAPARWQVELDYAAEILKEVGIPFDEVRL